MAQVISKDRSTWLDNQYVAAIESDGAWYALVQPDLAEDNYGKFRRHTGNYINKIEVIFGEKLSGIEWAYVLTKLWDGFDKDVTLVLSDPGTLRVEYLQLLSVFKEASQAPKVEYIRQVGKTFASKKDIDEYSKNHRFAVNGGQTYTDKDLLSLNDFYKRGTHLWNICNHMGRTALGVLGKMVNMGLIKYAANGDYICCVDVPKPCAHNENPCGEILSEVADHCALANEHLARVAEQLETISKEKSMTIATNPNVAIETKTVIFGQDAATLSETDLINAIKKVEGQIATLKEVKTSSKKIAANIKELEDQLQAIVEVLDAR